VKTKRLSIEIDERSISNELLIFSSFYKKEEVVKLIVKINTNDAFIKRIDSLVQGRGYGFETLEAVIKYLKQNGYKNFSAYIEKGNIKSEKMFSKLGFHQSDDGHQGNYWTLNKNILEKMNKELNFFRIT